jgi:hypothetical protein
MSRGEGDPQMKAKISIPVILLFALIFTGCGPEKPTFEISGSPETLYYGGLCPTPVLTFKVTGPGEGLRINSIIVAYQLFDGSGKKITEATLYLHPIPDAPSVSYDASRIIVVPDSGGSVPTSDSPIIDFGEGHIDFAATVYAKILSPSITGPDETYYFTSTKSIPVLPCLPVTIETIEQGPGDEIIIITLDAPTATPTFAPEPTKKPKGDSGDAPPQPPAPPSCSVEPNNPNCAP